MPSTTPSADTAPTADDGLDEDPPFVRALQWVLLIGGIIGLTAAFVLTVERFALVHHMRKRDDDQDQQGHDR